MHDDELDAMRGSFGWARIRGKKYLDRFVVGGVVLGLALIALSSLLVAPQNATALQRFAYVVVPFAGAVLIAIGSAYGWAFLLAPYQQRNDLRSVVTANAERLDAEARRRYRLQHDRAITGETFHIWELIDPDGKPIIFNRVLRECTIKGPAMVTLIGSSTFSQNQLGEGDIDSVLHEMVNPGGKQGIFAFANSDIIGCHFRAVGFYGPKELLDKLRKNTIIV